MVMVREGFGPARTEVQHILGREMVGCGPSYEKHNACSISKVCIRIEPSEGSGSAKRLTSRENNSENNTGACSEGTVPSPVFKANFRGVEAGMKAPECEASTLTTELTAPNTRLF